MTEDDREGLREKIIRAMNNGGGISVHPALVAVAHGFHPETGADLITFRRCGWRLADWQTPTQTCCASTASTLCWPTMAPSTPNVLTSWSTPSWASTRTTPRLDVPSTSTG
jgi:hypothetical protein